MWTAEQEAAITARNWSVLVSAAAGSGKTAVLVERVIRLVLEGQKLSRMLIVTFTRAAAGEMRQRLNQRLNEMLREEGDDLPGEMRSRLEVALDELPDAQMSTIHAFCQHVLKQDFQQVDIDPQMRVADASRVDELFKQAFREALNRLIAEGSEDFRLLLDCFRVNQLFDMTDALHGFLMSLYHPWDWLDRACGTAASPLSVGHPWVKALLKSAENRISEMTARAGLLRALMDEPDAAEVYAPAVASDLALAERIAGAGDTFSAVRAAKGAEVVKLASARKLTEEQLAWKERFQKVRGEFKKALKDVAAWAAFDADKEGEEMARMASCLRGLRDLTRETDERFAALKREKSLIDFSDMEQLTLRILDDPERRRRYQEEYDFLFVDEVQDVSEAQDAIISAVHGPESCLFLVGDVKQSIYRFRRADPTIFMRKVSAWSDAPDARERRIFLTRNFRSRPTVLEAANQVFNRAMQPEVTELSYMPQDWLVPKKETDDDPPCELLLADDEAVGMKPIEAEAMAAAQRIRALVGQRYLSYDGKEQTLRYRDICVLMRETATSGDIVSRILTDCGIPVYFDSNACYTELQEVRSLADMLQVIDNPMQDMALYSTLRSDWFGFADEELADIRLNLSGGDEAFHKAFEACLTADTPLGEKCRRVMEVIQSWRIRLDHARLSDFIWTLMHESGFYAAEGALPGGETRMANLRMFYAQAQQFEESGGVTLSDFLRVNQLRSEAGDARAARLLGENEDLVRVMTIHKSKGLEFPVVICMRSSQGMAHRGEGTLRTHPELGACLPVIRRTEHLTRESFAAGLFNERRTADERAESCRLLYVAMTRAKERLILSGALSEVSRDTLALPPGNSRVAAAKSMMDWVLSAAVDLNGSPELADFDAPPFRLRIVEPPLTPEKRRAAGQTQGEWITRLETCLPAEAPRWPGEETPSRLPRKISVTALTHQLSGDPLPPPDDDETPETKRGADNPMIVLSGELPDRPAFLMEQRRFTAAERGSLVHRFLALFPPECVLGLPSSALAEVLRQILSEQTAQGIWTPEEAAAIPLSAVRTWLESELGRRALSSPTLRRELPFNLALREEDALLQGVIDCCFIERGRWILIDYKTDHITDLAAFARKHQPQLALYARALETITGLPVAEQWLYALEVGEAVRVMESGERRAE
ncbi:MAG: UvrD-helicase domain-containing protein [Clostridia bacterium]|nr:UvrD-helicase domain-containing protein [Clostridia bacterium]